MARKHWLLPDNIFNETVSSEQGIIVASRRPSLIFGAFEFESLCLRHSALCGGHSPTDLLVRPPSIRARTPFPTTVAPTLGPLLSICQACAPQLGPSAPTACTTVSQSCAGHSIACLAHSPRNYRPNFRNRSPIFFYPSLDTYTHQLVVNMPHKIG